MAPVGTSGTWFAFWKDHQTLPADVQEGTVDPEGLGREAETLAELGAGVPLSWAGTWCRWREARVNGDQGGCGEVREALIVNVSDVLLQHLKKKLRPAHCGLGLPAFFFLSE